MAKVFEALANAFIAKMNCNWLNSNPLQGFAYTVDTIDGNVFPFVRYCRAQWGLMSFIGTPYRTLTQCIDGRD